MIIFLLLFFPLFLCAEESPDSATGEWNGARTQMRQHGVELYPSLILNEGWNLHGGRRRHGGEFEYLFDVILQAKTGPLMHYEGGTFYADYAMHHGQGVSRKDVGSYIRVNVIDAHPFDELYALWYKQVFSKDQFWLLVGKSDAYDHFSTTKHSELLLNAGYSTLPTCPFFPTYPEPAMSVVASLALFKELSVTFGVFDGSRAKGFDTGRHAVFGHFFKDLGSHAFLIGEADIVWNSTGQLAIGGWRNTSTFHQFDGGDKKGTEGPYATLDQILYRNPQEEVGLFLIYASANPDVIKVHRYYAAGLEWRGFTSTRPKDILGFGWSQVNFSSKAGFTKRYEASYEVYYHFHPLPWMHLQPDLQYIVHPGGKSLANAIVFALNLRLTL